MTELKNCQWRRNRLRLFPLTLLAGAVGLYSLATISIASASSFGTAIAAASKASEGAATPVKHVKGSDGVDVRLRLQVLSGCREILYATVKKRPAANTGDITGAFTVKSPPTGALSLVTYEPNSGLLTAYVAPQVARVRWLGANGKTVIDTLRPWRRWVAEVGPIVGERVPVNSTTQPVPITAGSLVAINRAGKKIASIRVSVTNDIDKPTVPFSC